MPRPGPRPFECVRRAWHSDRHQPMRGSIIQQIFRVVHGSHKPATKKNREWQEKLPCVVLKAEEIMYSKANSEAEYMDLETLWDRVSDAINTIIRRDESTETGELLPPCVEAALNLGCVPVRASRSQRHNNPRSYLSPRTQDSTSQAPKNFETAINEPNTTLPFNSRNQSTSERQLKLSHSISESNKHAAAQKNKNIPLGTNAGRVYPLYTGTHFQPEPTRLHHQALTNSNMIIVGRPVFPLITEPAQMGCLQNLFSHDRNENASNIIDESHLRNDECDLSLRLGMYREPCSSKDGFDSRSFQEGERPQSKEFSFFPVESASHQFAFSTNRLNFLGEGSNEQQQQPGYRKRKFSSNQTLEDGQLELYSNHFPGRMKRHEGI